MLNQIRSEWIKLRSVRSNLVMLLISLVIGVGVAALSASTAGEEPLDVASALTGVNFAGVLFLVLGVQIIGQEYRFNTIRTTFSATPRRGRVVAAKAAVLVGAVAVVAAIVIAASVGLASVITRAKGGHLDLTSGNAQRLLVGTLVACVLSAAFGYAIGCLVRQPVAGIVIALAWSAVVELPLSSMIHGSGKWLPNLSASNLTAPQIDPAQLSPLAGGLYSATVMVALTVLGYLRLSRQDA